MPYRYYHGRTGKIFHVVKRAVGVLINKRVRYRIMRKRQVVQKSEKVVMEEKNSHLEELRRQE